MDEINDQIQAWGDEVMRTAGTSVTADEAKGRSPARPGLRRPEGLRASRWLVGAAAAAVLLVAALAVVDRRGDGGEQVTAADPRSTLPSNSAQTSPPTNPRPGSGPVKFEVLSSGPALMDTMGTMWPATNADDLAERWANAGQPPPAPEVDFESQFVVSITIPDDACPPELTHFDRREEVVEVPGEIVIEPVFVEPPGPCRESLMPKTYVVAVGWASTGDDFWVYLPGQPNYGYEDSWLHYVRDLAVGSFEVPAQPDPGGTKAVIRAAIQAGVTSEIPTVVPTVGPGPLAATGALSLSFTLLSGDDAVLSWAEVTAERPEDPRRGLSEPTTVGTDAGGTVWIGKMPTAGAVLRFDCDGVRYQLEAKTGPSALLEVVDRLASELGCETPTTSAPTECLGLSYDPAVCTED